MNMAEFAIEHLWIVLPLLVALGLVIAGIRWLVQRAKIWWLVHHGVRTKSNSNTTPTTPSSYGRLNDGWWNESKGGSDPYDK